MNSSRKIEDNGCQSLIDLFNNRYQGGDFTLSQRKQDYTDFFKNQYKAFKSQMAPIVLSKRDAVETAAIHSDWMDQWIRFTWWFVLKEEMDLMREVSKSVNQKVPYLEKVLPQKIEKKDELESILSADHDPSVRMEPAERSYYFNLLKSLEKEIQDIQQEYAVLSSIVPLDIKEGSDETDLLDHLLVFARGGYGRTELSFSSDVDLAYCLDVKSATNLEILTIQELIKRMEELFQGIPLDLASQYFELGEDLSRFSRTDMMHTIPSILEGRVILGNASLLISIKKEFSNVCPRQKMIRFLKRQMDELSQAGNEIFYIKEGFGGVRHLQYVLWMVLIIENQENGNSIDLLEMLKKRGWISEIDRQNLVLALEFYIDLRNFIGLYDYFRESLHKTSIEHDLEGKVVVKDFLNDTAVLAYLKLKQRFITVDYLDRFRLYSIGIVSSNADSIVSRMLNRTIAEILPGFILYKHLGSNRIVRFQMLDEKPKTAWNLKTQSEQRRKSDEDLQHEVLKDLFADFKNLFDLFLYISRTGNKLSQSLINGFSSLVTHLYSQPRDFDTLNVKRFVFDLFTSENASSAIEQMMDIAAPLSREGLLKTLLGLFIPEVNQMRYLLRNLDVHEFPLCLHSLKALKQVELEIESSQKEEPELWRFISEKDIFALKWSTFFHDIGKINPYRNHEKLGPILSSEMLVRIGWDENDELLDLTRLLVENHQSIVRFSQLSTYLDLGILKFFELAQRDPGKVLLLYLINLSDFKSVNSEMEQKAAHLESFFEKTMSILGEFKREKLPQSMTEIVNNYLNRKVKEIRTSVLLELLLRQCCNKSLEDVIISPLSTMSPNELKSLEKRREELENSLAFLKLAELDAPSLEKHRFRFIQIIQEIISEGNIFSIVAPLSRSWNWFFTSIPNRYLLSSRVETLTTQLQEFEQNLNQKICLSYVKGDQGEYDSILFHFIDEKLVQAKLAYALSWQGLNIENGKINKIQYANGQEGFVGFFRISSRSKADRKTNIELANVIDNLIIPPLNPQPVSVRKKLSKVQLQHFLEQEKGYLIKEVNKEQFKRVPERYVAVKISLFDAPFVYYKILRTFEAFGVFPEQITVTTIGNQIIDYFYLPESDRKIIKNNEFKRVLLKYINAEITIT
ncbi:hypothetical protein KJ966_16800 [bacterium]|nr:hypothetical protein [bacterium]